MRFFAVHDTAGNIARVIGCPDGAPPTLPGSVAAGHALTEVELPDGVAVAPDRDVLADLAAVAAEYRIDVRPVPAVRLLRRDETAGD